jgi:hypothetical protein
MMSVTAAPSDKPSYMTQQVDVVLQSALAARPAALLTFHPSPSCGCLGGF